MNCKNFGETKLAKKLKTVLKMISLGEVNNGLYFQD